METSERRRDDYVVEIVFRGVCPLVPGADLDAGEQPRWVGAFLVRADSASKKEFGVPSELKVHFPFVIYNTRDLVGQEEAPDELVLSPLRDVDVRIVTPDGSDEDLIVDVAGRELGETPVDEAEGNLFDWVTPMDGILPGSGQVDKECFEDDPSRRLVARVHIDRGLLQTNELGMIEGDPVVVPVRKNSFVRYASVAKSVKWTLECAPGDFVLQMTSFDDPDSDPRVLVFRQPPSGIALKIEIVNLCVGDLFPEASSLTDEEALRPDRDFLWNYLISSKAERCIQQGRVPGPFERSVALDIVLSAVGGGGVKGALCSPPKSAPVVDEVVLEKMVKMARGSRAEVGG